MKDPKTTLRYLGFRPLPSGARCLDFSLGDSEAVLRKITVEAPKDLFSGPERVALQECAGICYETLKCRVIGILRHSPFFHQPHVVRRQPAPETRKELRAHRDTPEQRGLSVSE